MRRAIIIGSLAVLGLIAVVATARIEPPEDPMKPVCADTHTGRNYASQAAVRSGLADVLVARNVEYAGGCAFRVTVGSDTVRSIPDSVQLVTFYPPTATGKGAYQITVAPQK